MAPGAATKQQQLDLQTATRCFKGRAVRKKFGSHGFFDGRVLEVWSDGKQTFAHVKYEDGDREDLDLHELRKILVDKPSSEGGSGGATGSSSSSSKPPLHPGSGKAGEHHPHKRPSSSSSSGGGGALKKVKREKGADGREMGRKDKDKSKRRPKDRGDRVKVKREKGVAGDATDDYSGEEKDDFGFSSGSEKPPRRRKPQHPQQQEPGGAAARKSDAYRAGLRTLIAEGVLEAGEDCVRVSRGAEGVAAALLANGDVRYKGGWMIVDA